MQADHRLSAQPLRRGPRVFDVGCGFVPASVADNAGTGPYRDRDLRLDPSGVPAFGTLPRADPDELDDPL